MGFDGKTIQLVVDVKKILKLIGNKHIVRIWFSTWGCDTQTTVGLSWKWEGNIGSQVAEEFFSTCGTIGFQRRGLLHRNTN